MKTLNKYWIVIAVIVYFALTAVYHQLGESKSVFWTLYMNTLRASFVLLLLFKVSFNAVNIWSIFSCYGAMSYFISLTTLRFIVAFKANFNYEVYFKYLSNESLSFWITLMIALIMLCVRFYNPIINFLEKILKWKEK